jgi:hypothetical protein
MDYQLTNTTTIIRLTDGLLFEPDPLHSVYADYLQWINEGNIPKPCAEVSSLTIEQKLSSIGLTVDDVKTLIGITT